MRVSGFTSLPSFYSMTGSWTTQARRAVLVACDSAVLARDLGSLLHSGYAVGAYAPLACSRTRTTSRRSRCLIAPESGLAHGEGVPWTATRLCGHHVGMSSTVMSRRALAGLVALGGAGVMASCRGGGGGAVASSPSGGACPRPGREPGVETRILNDHDDADGRLWQAATAASWRTDTGLRFTGSLSGDYLDYDGPERLGSSRQDFAEMPKLVHEDENCVVVQAGAGVCALERADGRVRWSVVLEASQGLVAGGVSRGLVWTNAGAVDLGTGEVRGAPEAASRADNLVAGEGVVVTVVPRYGDRSELVCLESRGCSERWRTEIDDPGTASLRLGDNEVSIGMSNYYDLDSGEYHLALVDVSPPRPREGVFLVVDTEAGRWVRVVVDDDGTGVAVRAFAPQEGMYDAGYREQYTSGEELWSVPLEARPGSVVAIDSALGKQGSSFWVVDLDDSGALYLSHWQPGPA